ncbi:MAG: HlyC/CorC family transporter [Ignavibacteria bacterium]|nr:HlyC/CorC family transporter [Ignavibacteria bacterium]
MPEFETFLLEMILIFTFIFINGFFVSFEYALIKIRNSEIETLIQKGNHRALILKNLKDNIERYISATQLGITAVNLLLGWIGEDILSDIFRPLFNYLGLSTSLMNTFSVLLGIILITYLTIVIGELVPKVIAIRYTKQTSLWLAFPIKLFYRTFKPFIWILERSANLFLKIIGIEPVSKTDMVSSEEEIRYLINEGRKTGVIDSTEHQLIEKIFDFNDKAAKDIMVPRNSIVAINILDSREKIIKTVVEEGFSRIPVFKDSLDNIIGILYSKDLISASEHRDLIVLQDILRTAHFVPETKHIGEILKDFQRKHIHMGIVINEHGGVEGLITFEDIIEEIVGEIEDEYDVDTKTVEKDRFGIYLVNPVISIEEFNKKFKSSIPENPDEYLTLSGFLQFVTGHIPEIYERIDYKGLIFIISKKAGNKLLQVKIQRTVV